jgi:hypothetical protein
MNQLTLVKHIPTENQPERFLKAGGVTLSWLAFSLPAVLLQFMRVLPKSLT